MIDENDIIVCVQEYPEDGDQAKVGFFNLTKIEALTCPSAKAWAKGVRKAMAFSAKSAAIDPNLFVCYGTNDEVEKCKVDLPCMVSDLVTIYES